mmetsp:Transcript_49964/g.150258  ORF Transcript_49964/g.150258 Transcript_49964/m.150258 type:complete len:198 (-) Transcript_49964:2054-2647(-)
MIGSRLHSFAATSLILALCVVGSSAFTFYHKTAAHSTTMSLPAEPSTSTGEDLQISALTADEPDVASCFSIRRTVFIEEQRVPEDIEMDGRDSSATHILAVRGGVPCGAARLLISEDGTGKIGRVCVLPSQRRKGVGRSIVLAAVEELRRSPRCHQAKLGAQVHALTFYESMGFQLIPGEEYMDAGGVPHRDMEISL